MTEIVNKDSDNVPGSLDPSKGDFVYTIIITKTEDEKRGRVVAHHKIQ